MSPALAGGFLTTAPPGKPSPPVLSTHSSCLLTFLIPPELLFFKKIIYFWLHWVFVVVRGLSLVAVSGGYSFVAVHGLLIAVASFVAEHGL